ncbi:hypothetical protein O3M35_010619 [Rhynocoris fuscipes]|uniref:Elongation of very long chain fatty acids protein n=1 Tax=Rhynocoris fuscipes TaxID=488301 RepID=A0AAW1CZX4_9HEMI
MELTTSELVSENCTKQPLPFDSDEVNSYISSLPIISSPPHLIIGILSYLLAIKILLPKYMENKKPYNLGTVTRFYNLFQIIANTTICYLYFFRVKQTAPFDIWHDVCRHVTGGNNFDATNYKLIVEIQIMYYTLKYIDLVETAFFIFRKKFNQVSFLHVYHHVIVIISMWININYYRVEASATLLTLNSFVHAIMYIYYFLSSFGPEIQKYLWWKRYLTVIQIIQFLMGLSILIKMYLDQCANLSSFYYLWGFTTTTILCLFIHFYIKTYKKKSE